MRTSKILVLGAAAVVSCNVFAVEQTGPQLVSVQYFTEGPTIVALPTVKSTDGSICTSYVASTSRDQDGKVDALVKQACDSPKSHLLSIRDVEQDGLTTQIPEYQVKQ